MFYVIIKLFYFYVINLIVLVESQLVFDFIAKLYKSLFFYRLYIAWFVAVI